VRNVDANYLLKKSLFMPALRDLVHRLKQESQCKIVLAAADSRCFPGKFLRIRAPISACRIRGKAMPEWFGALESGGELAKIAIWPGGTKGRPASQCGIEVRL